MGNMKAGGLSDVLVKVEFIILPLSKDDNEPTANGMRMQIISTLLSFIFMFNTV